MGDASFTSLRVHSIGGGEGGGGAKEEEEAGGGRGGRGDLNVGFATSLRSHSLAFASVALIMCIFSLLRTFSAIFPKTALPASL